MRIGSLCTGYGGIELGLTQAGLEFDAAWYAEIEPALLRNLGDLNVVDWSDVEPVDMIVGGIPCQPVSIAGRQQADADPRWLWPAALAALAALSASDGACLAASDQLQ